ncbi:MAG: hypothetical protein H6619_06965 [Deltaproteobacteria bacterium]|nr:hypothetical protein [Deltaproteobacteria bacterium]
MREEYDLLPGDLSEENLKLSDKQNRGDQIGAYTLEKHLARGGFSQVFEAHPDIGGIVAIKIPEAGGGRYTPRNEKIVKTRGPEWISPDETPAEAIHFGESQVSIDFISAIEGSEAILAEYEKLKSMRERAGRFARHIVCPHEVVIDDDRSCLVLQHLRGLTLRETLRNLDGIKLNWFLSLAETLFAIQTNADPNKPGHNYHGDLKPENIIITEDKQVVMLDPSVGLSSGVELLTPHYNPLLFKDSRADVMALGIMLYEITAGVPPFDDVPWVFAGREQVGEIERLSLQYFLSYKPVQEWNPNVPEKLARIAHNCITNYESYTLKDYINDVRDFLRE